MKFTNLIKKITSTKKALLAVLIDPDKFNEELIKISDPKKVTCFLVGGSELKKGNTVKKTVTAIKKISSIPVILFPGNEHQLCAEADGLFLPSLLSGRNTDYLIEKHIQSAQIIKRMNLSHLPMAYLLIDGGKQSQTQIVTSTTPLNPKNKSYIINTALAAQQLGFKLLYLEAGSGAKTPIKNALINKIAEQTNLPIIVGGGVMNEQQLITAKASNAKLIVIGTALEKNISLLPKFCKFF